LNDNDGFRVHANLGSNRANKATVLGLEQLLQERTIARLTLRTCLQHSIICVVLEPWRIERAVSQSVVAVDGEKLRRSNVCLPNVRSAWSLTWQPSSPQGEPDRKGDERCTLKGLRRKRLVERWRTPVWPSCHVLLQSSWYLPAYSTF